MSTLETNEPFEDVLFLELGVCLSIEKAMRLKLVWNRDQQTKDVHRCRFPDPLEIDAKYLWLVKHPVVGLDLMRAARHPVTILLLRPGQLVLESPDKPLVPLRYLIDLIRTVTPYLLQQSDHFLGVHSCGKQVFVLIRDRCCLVARQAHVLNCLLLVKARVDETSLLTWLVDHIEG